MQFYAASTMKVPVMIALFRRYDAGLLDLDRSVRLTSTFTSVHDRSPFAIEFADVDDELVSAEGQSRTARELIERMITLSSNNATNLLLNLLPMSDVQEVATSLGATGTVIARPIGDRAAAAAGVENLVTAGDLVTIMTAVATGKAASPASCQEMTRILARQKHTEALPAGLPAYVPSASKGGWVESLRHDVAVVWPPDGRAYCHAVCTRGLPDDEALATIRQRAGYAFSRYGRTA